MSNEDFFKENFPEYVTEKGEFLSPYWDLFSAGVICATFELKKENKELKEVHESDKRSLALIAKKGAELEKACNETQEFLNKQIEATYKLGEENAELKDKLNNLASVAEVRLANWQKYEKENTELEEQISTKDIQIKELQEQKVYWKESSFDWRHKFFEKGSTKRLVKKSKQLTKAKDLIRNLLRVTYGAGWNYSLDWKVKAEQFLKE